VKRFVAAAVLLLASGGALHADAAVREKLLRHFGGWYSYYPNSRVAVMETDEVAIPGFEAYRVQRQTDSKRHQEAGITLYDAAREEVFVGRVLHDAARAAARRPYDPLIDGPEIEKNLSESFGSQATLTVKGSRGSLKEANVAVRQLSQVWLNLPGFVSADGGTILLGEFQSLREGPVAHRRSLLAEKPGVRLGKGEPVVVEFIDFQCERCRKRAPEVKKFVAERGGSVEVRFYPLVKVHDWAFAAAESAAGLAALSPQLYESYEAALFARAGTMSESAARQLAADVAEAAGKGKELAAEVSSGRARDRVLSDLRLGILIGVTGTPYFLHDGTLVSAEPELLEAMIRERLGEPPAPKAQ